MIACDEIRHVIDIASTKIANTLATIGTSAVLISCHKKKKRYKIECYILPEVLLAIILKSKITNFCYHYVKQKVLMH